MDIFQLIPKHILPSLEEHFKKTKFFNFNLILILQFLNPIILSFNGHLKLKLWEKMKIYLFALIVLLINIFILLLWWDIDRIFFFLPLINSLINKYMYLNQNHYYKYFSYLSTFLFNTSSKGPINLLNELKSQYNNTTSVLLFI